MRKVQAVTFAACSTKCGASKGRVMGITWLFDHSLGGGLLVCTERFIPSCLVEASASVQGKSSCLSATTTLAVTRRGRWSNDDVFKPPSVQTTTGQNRCFGIEEKKSPGMSKQQHATLFMHALKGINRGNPVAREETTKVYWVMSILRFSCRVLGRQACHPNRWRSDLNTDDQPICMCGFTRSQSAICTHSS